MATRADVRKIALALPEVREEEGRFAFSVDDKGKAKAIAWVWMERVDPKKPRVANARVVAVRVSSLADKELLLASDAEGERFFTDAHYNGFPAVLVRLSAIGVPELRELITDAWRCQAPKALTKAFDGASR